MGTIASIDATRHALGQVGVILPVSFTAPPPIDLQRAAVSRLESAGYLATWTNEVIGKDALVQLALLLASTRRMTLGTCIANIWVREPQTAHAAAALLAQAFPGRFVLGLGAGYPEQAASTGREWGSPLAAMRAYLERMDSQAQAPAPDAAYPRIIAANGPKMLALASEVADGALPAGQPPRFTALARQVLGPDKLLVVAVPVVIDAEHDQAAISATVREHLAAGADHVILMVPPGGDFTAGVSQLTGLAPTLAGLTRELP
jgi:probable F420-dependent oxidoreductase